MDRPNRSLVLAMAIISKSKAGRENGLLDELSGWVRCFWVVGLLLNPVGRAFPVDVTGGGQGRAL